MDVKLEDYVGDVPAWCPGCGNFGILTAMKRALVELGLRPDQVLIASGIGQAGKFPHYLKCNTLNGLHGRALPLGIAAKIANPELTVIVVGGDGDGYGEGGNHWLHACRRNPDITYLVFDNQVYALTKGQASPTSDPDFKASPPGASIRLNPLAVAIAAEATFVARGYPGDQDHLVELIKAGIRHRGFSFIDIQQPCVSFNFKNTWMWDNERVYKLEYNGHNPRDKYAALHMAEKWGDKFPIGIFYQTEKQTFEDNFPALKKGPLVKQPIDPIRVEKLFDEFV